MAYSGITHDQSQALLKESFADQIMQQVSEQSNCLKLMKQLPTLPAYRQSIPVLSAFPTAGFFSVGTTGAPGEIPASSAAWENVYLYAEDVGAIVPIPKDMIDDSGYDMDASLYPAISQALALVIDKAMIHGTNKPTNWPAGIYTEALAAGNVVSQAAHADIYDALFESTGVFGVVEADGYMVNGAIASLPMMAGLRSCRGADGQPLFWQNPQMKATYTINGVTLNFDELGAVASTNSVKAVVGDWSKAVYAYRKGLTIDLLKEATINTTPGADPVNLAQSNMVAIRAVLRVGWAHPNPINLIQGTKASRSSFGILTA